MSFTAEHVSHVQRGALGASPHAAHERANAAFRSVHEPQTQLPAACKRATAAADIKRAHAQALKMDGGEAHNNTGG